MEPQGIPCLIPFSRAVCVQVGRPSGYLPLGSPCAGNQHHTLQSGPGSRPISLLISTIAPALFLTWCIPTWDLHAFNPCFCWKPIGDTISEQHPDLQQKPSCVTDQGSWTRSIEVGKRPDTNSGEEKLYWDSHEGAKTSNMFPCWLQRVGEPVPHMR